MRQGRPRFYISSLNCGAMQVWRGRGLTLRDGSLTAVTGLLAWTLKVWLNVTKLSLIKLSNASENLYLVGWSRVRISKEETLSEAEGSK